MGSFERERERYPVRLICRVMGVSCGGYYAYTCGTSWSKSKDDEALHRWVKKVFRDHERRYGSRWISEELKSIGVKAGRYRVRSLMNKLGLRRSSRGVLFPGRRSRIHRRASKNLLTSISPKEPKVLLVGDVTYLPLFGGKWCYLASWQDKVSKRVAGWSVSDRMTEDLVIGALNKALTRGFIAKDAIIHSDRGSQYASKAFRKLLSERGLRQSMSGKGNCCDNDQAESFWAKLKTELLEGGAFQSVLFNRSKRPASRPSATSTAITTGSADTQPSGTSARTSSRSDSKLQTLKKQANQIEKKSA